MAVGAAVEEKKGEKVVGKEKGAAVEAKGAGVEEAKNFWMR